MTIVGIATDFCVRATAEDALRAGFGVTVIEDLCAAVSEDGATQALDALKAAGAEVIAQPR